VSSAPRLRSSATRKVKTGHSHVTSSTLFCNDKRAESVSAEESNAGSDMSSDFGLGIEAYGDDSDDDVIRTDRTSLRATDDEAEGDSGEEVVAKSDWNSELGMTNTELRALQYGTRSKRARCS
jgi:hypothetical protein